MTSVASPRSVSMSTPPTPSQWWPATRAPSWAPPRNQSLDILAFLRFMARVSSRFLLVFFTIYSSMLYLRTIKFGSFNYDKHYTSFFCYFSSYTFNLMMKSLVEKLRLGIRVAKLWSFVHKRSWMRRWTRGVSCNLVLQWCVCTKARLTHRDRPGRTDASSSVNVSTNKQEDTSAQRGNLTFLIIHLKKNKFP